ncbi:MAG TPA: hypothetical protein VLF91_06635 [Candidatus Saccharimonadales bacterium]|nr:hypothetical protein [Candidatus Saccharimonadales bacterium]
MPGSAVRPVEGNLNFTGLLDTVQTIITNRNGPAAISGEELALKASTVHDLVRNTLAKLTAHIKRLNARLAAKDKEIVGLREQLTEQSDRLTYASMLVENLRDSAFVTAQVAGMVNSVDYGKEWDREPIFYPTRMEFSPPGVLVSYSTTDNVVEVYIDDLRRPKLSLAVPHDGRLTEEQCAAMLACLQKAAQTNPPDELVRRAIGRAAVYSSE